MKILDGKINWYEKSPLKSPELSLLVEKEVEQKDFPPSSFQSIYSTEVGLFHFSKQGDYIWGFYEEDEEFPFRPAIELALNYYTSLSCIRVWVTDRERLFQAGAIMTPIFVDVKAILPFLSERGVRVEMQEHEQGVEYVLYKKAPLKRAYLPLPELLMTGFLEMTTVAGRAVLVSKIEQYFHKMYGSNWKQDLNINERVVSLDQR